MRVTDRDGAFERAEPGLEPVTIAWTYADNPANDAQPRDRDVDRVVARLFAERAKQEAVALNRSGQFDDAGQALEGVRKRIAAYAGSDAELRRIAAELRRGGAGLRRPDARDGAQAAPLRGERVAPHADAGREVDAAGLSPATAARRDRRDEPLHP